MSSMDQPKNGELAVIETAQQMPDVALNLVKIQAPAGNGGKVYVGGAGVTRIGGGADSTTGFELSPGKDTGWLLVSNLKFLYYIGENSSDKLIYFGLL